MLTSVRSVKRRKISDDRVAGLTQPEAMHCMQGAYKKVINAVYGENSSEGTSFDPPQIQELQHTATHRPNEDEESRKHNDMEAGEMARMPASCRVNSKEERNEGGKPGGSRAANQSPPMRHATGSDIAVKQHDQPANSDEGSQTENENFRSKSFDPEQMKKPQWRGWIAVQEEDVPINSQNAFEEIAKKAAEEARQVEQRGGKPKKSLRERPRTEHVPKTKTHSEERGSKKKQRAKCDNDRHRASANTSNNQLVGHGRRDDQRDTNVILEDGASGPSPSLLDLGTETMVQVAVPTGSTPRKKKKKEKEHTLGSKDLTFPTATCKLPLNTTCPTPLPKEHHLDDDAQILQNLLSSQPSSLDVVKAHIISRLTSAKHAENCAEFNKVHQLLSQTVLAGEGNSMLIIGSRGTGKTALVETAIIDLRREHRDDFHVVRLNGFIHTDDKIALKAIWRQLGREVDVEDEITRGKSNYADLLARLLALLSHEDEAAPEGNDDQHRAVAKSVIFVLDEFHLFASHPRQTLLYNLFDLAQSSTTPLAVLGLTTRVDVVDMLEKRVKSRFGQRVVQTNPPRTFEAFKEACRNGLMYHPVNSHAAITRPQTPMLPPAIPPLWNHYISNLLSTPALVHLLQNFYTSTRLPYTFFTSAILPILSLSSTSPLPTPEAFISSASDLQPPDSDLTSLLLTLSTLALALLISAARLEILLAPNTSATTAASTTAVAVTFDIVYDEYVALAAKTRLNASASGALATSSHAGGGRVWGKKIARTEWERLAELGIVVPMTAGAGRGLGEGRWCVDIGGLEEIGAWCEGEGKKSVGGLGKWCRI